MSPRRIRTGDRGRKQVGPPTARAPARSSREDFVRGDQAAITVALKEKAKTGELNIMTTGLLGAIDCWLTLPLCLVVRWVNRGLAPLSGRRGPAARPQTICLAKFAGLGSIINTTPLLRAVRKRYPSGHIVYLTFARHEELVRRLTPVDEGLFIDDRSLWSLARSLYFVARRLKQLAPTCYLDLQYYSVCYFSALVAILSGAPQVVGFIRQPSLAKKRFLTCAVYFNAFQPLQEAFRQIAAAIGCELCASSPAGECSLRIFSKDQEEVKQYLSRREKQPRRLLVVNANASAACLERRWPKESFAETVRGLLRRMSDLHVVLIGAADERGCVEGLRYAIGPDNQRVLNLAGVLSQGGLLALLRQADCLLSNDSGPMHAGFALGTPTVALFGPANPQDHISQADLRKSVIFYAPVFCSPCIHFISPPPCGGDNTCMRLIPVASVREACLALLTGKALRGSLAAQWRPPAFVAPTVAWGAPHDALYVHRCAPS